MAGSTQTHLVSVTLIAVPLTVRSDRSHCHPDLLFGATLWDAESQAKGDCSTHRESIAHVLKLRLMIWLQFLSEKLGLPCFDRPVL
jgi:hypothetical protein